MSAKKPPEHLIKQIYDACAEKRSGVQIAEMLGIPICTIKPAISWMLEFKHLIGHRGAGKARFHGYVQNRPAAIPLGRPMQPVDRMDFTDLCQYFPLSSIRSEDIHHGQPDIHHLISKK